MEISGSPLCVSDHLSNCRPCWDPCLEPPVAGSSGVRDLGQAGCVISAVARPPSCPHPTPHSASVFPRRAIRGHWSGRPSASVQVLIVPPPGCIFSGIDEPLSPETQPESELNSRRIGSPPHQSACGHCAGEEAGVWAGRRRSPGLPRLSVWSFATANLPSGADALLSVQEFAG